MSNRLLILAICVGIAASASANVISMNMTDGGTLGGPSAGGTAGVVLAGYWNEVMPGGNDEHKADHR